MGLRRSNGGACEENTGSRLFWHDAIRMYTPFWFGRPFWFQVLLWLLLVPGVEVIVLSEFNLSGPLACLLAAADLAGAGFLFVLAWGLTSFGTHAFTVPVGLMEFLERACPVEYASIRYSAEQSRGDAAASQKSSFIDELVNTPFPFKIFTRYIWRPALVVLGIPLYVGVGMIAIEAIPKAHQVDERGGGVEVVQSLEVIRDLQMGMLSGSSTEHQPQASEKMYRDDDSGGDPEESMEAVSPGGGSSEVGGLGGVKARSGAVWKLVAWEVVGILCAFLYLGLAFILLPLQIGIVATLERHLKSPEFWKRQLRSW